MVSSGVELDQAVVALRELFLASEHYRHAAGAYLGLDISQTQALSYLRNRGPLGPTELGLLLGLNTSSITALIDRLEAGGMARRRPHPSDRRRAVVELSDHGTAAITAM